MNPPATIRILHLDFELRFADKIFFDAAKTFGYCDKERLTITVQEKLRPALMADVVWHELGHACFFAAGIADNGLTEEAVCLQLVGPMLCIAKDNPGLLAWTSYLLRPGDVDDGAYV